MRDVDRIVPRRERITAGSLTKLFDTVAQRRRANRGWRVVSIPTKRRDPSGTVYDVDVEIMETFGERIARTCPAIEHPRLAEAVKGERAK